MARLRFAWLSVLNFESASCEEPLGSKSVRSVQWKLYDFRLGELRWFLEVFGRRRGGTPGTPVACRALGSSREEKRSAALALLLVFTW